MTSMSTTKSQGTENLEIMAEAKNYNAWLLAMIWDAIAGKHRVLDFGAGTGQFALPIARAGRSVVAVEPEERTRRLLVDGGLEVHADLSAIPDQSIDAVYTLNVLEHIFDDLAALHQLRRCLKPGGVLFIYVPAFMLLSPQWIGAWARFADMGESC